MERYYGEAERFYINRTVGGNSHYRIINVDIDARSCKGKKTGEADSLSGKPQAMGYYIFDVYKR
jgi:hypothetical protein